MRLASGAIKVRAQKFLAESIGRWCAPANGRNVIFCYHSIDPAARFATPPHRFEQHLVYLRECCEVAPFTEIERPSEEVPPRPRVAITFDDGYLDNYEIAAPLLLKYGMKATFFLAAGFLDGQRDVAERLCAGWHAGPGKVRPMEWSQVRELQKLGMEIGAHSYSHTVLAHLDRAAASRELSDSKDSIEQHIGTAVTSLAYPYGRPGFAFDRETVELAGRAGYARAATVLYRAVRRSDPVLRLPRFIADQDEPAVLRQKVLGWWDFGGRLAEARGARRFLGR